MTQTLMRRMAKDQLKRIQRNARLWRLVGWIGIALTLVLSLMPPTFQPTGGHLDKVEHLIGYAILMFWWSQLVVWRREKLAMFLILFGIAIELLQGLTPYRQPDLLDVLANTGGVLIGWLLARKLPNLLDRLSTLSVAQR